MNQNIAVFIASHLSHPRRFSFLFDCLYSLLHQTHLPQIYLSLSFESPDIRNEFDLLFANIPLFSQYAARLHLHIRPIKTAQMRHIQYLSTIPNLPPWILFCDDDDLYAATRVAEFAAKFTPDFAGVYESSFGKTHEEHRHEYWCYGIRTDVLHTFFQKMTPFSAYIDHRCADVLFAEYLRRLHSPFHRLPLELYHYRRENNEDSITGSIMQQQTTTVRLANPPEPNDPSLLNYLQEWNQYLHTHLDIYLHDTFLRTIVGVDFDSILRAEFLADYPYLDRVDACHVQKMYVEWQTIRHMCHVIYEQPF